MSLLACLFYLFNHCMLMGCKQVMRKATKNSLDMDLQKKLFIALFSHVLVTVCAYFTYKSISNPLHSGNREVNNCEDEYSCLYILYTQSDWKGIMLNDEVEIGTAFIVTTSTQKSVEQMLLQFLLFILTKK